MQPDADALRDRLLDLGVRARVAADGALAVLRVEPSAPSVWAERSGRAAIVEAARACGFTHVALELTADASGDR
jgi:hypothetical protein